MPLYSTSLERVGGEREVREGDEAGRGDPDRQDPRAAAVGARGGSPPHAGRFACPSCSGDVTANEQHRPRERRARLDDLAVAAEQLHERALGPVVQVPGGVPEVLQVGAAGHVQPAPQRLARDADQQVPGGDAGHLGDRVLGVGHVLEHLDRRRDVELAVGERHPLGLHDPVLEVGRLALLPLGLDRRVLEVDADHAAGRDPLRPLVGEHGLAAADVEQRLRGGLREQLVERALEAAPSGAARPGWWSRTCRRCCR